MSCDCDKFVMKNGTILLNLDDQIVWKISTIPSRTGGQGLTIPSRTDRQGLTIHPPRVRH